MSNGKYTDEFKSEAIRHETERGYKVREISERLGIFRKNLYLWLRVARKGNGKHSQGNDKELRQKIVRLKLELNRAEAGCLTHGCMAA